MIISVERLSTQCDVTWYVYKTNRKKEKEKEKKIKQETHTEQMYPMLWHFLLIERLVMIWPQIWREHSKSLKVPTQMLLLLLLILGFFFKFYTLDLKSKKKWNLVTIHIVIQLLDTIFLSKLQNYVNFWILQKNDFRMQKYLLKLDLKVIKLNPKFELWTSLYCLEIIILKSGFQHSSWKSF